ncbi:hypothetical protein [Verrucosispora sioxanthis]|uniref:hypothetical protein n=1 Tax=Verrucosispora sioxanthis TaxID=2499994 RepID=UPI001C0FE798|nr:hypothetical protein [Verrucosispora sioxanthis]
MPTTVATIEDRKRLARRLAGSGRGFAEQYGFRVTNNPSSLFQLLCLSVLLARRGDFRRAVDGAHALPDAGWDSAARLSSSSRSDRVRTLRDSGQRGDVEALADLLGELARAVVGRYRGDLRRLRSARVSERLAWLVGALARVDLEGRYAELTG